MRALLLSGGMDSAALAYWLRPDLAITVDYGQLPANGEIRAAAAIAAELSIPHEVITTDTRQLGCGTMAGDMSASGLAPEFWPFRNQLLITVAAMRIAKAGAGEVIVGTVASDAVHDDGRPAFIDACRQLLATQQPLINVQAPAIGMSSAELIRMSEIPEGLLGWTISCHTSSTGCGECRGCHKHIETRVALGSS